MPGGRRSVVPPRPCASPAPVPRRWPRPWTGCWRCSKRQVSRRRATRSRPRSTPKRSGSSARPRRTTGPLVGHAISTLPGGAEDPLRVLVAGSTGAMGGGQFGTALSAVQTIHHAGRPIHALVPEGRPGLEGSRVAAWELRQAGVSHAVVTDAAAPGRIAAGEVEAVLVGRRSDLRQRRRDRDGRRLPARPRLRRVRHPVHGVCGDHLHRPRDGRGHGRDASRKAGQRSCSGRQARASRPRAPWCATRSRTSCRRRS